MRKVLVYGYSSESNYGGVSLILGFRELLRAVDPAAEMICVEDGPVPIFAHKEHDFQSIRWPYSGIKRFWMDYVKFRLFGRKPRNPDRAAWWEWFAVADTVVALQGIAFCSKIGRKSGRLPALSACAGVFRDYSPNLAARLMGKRSIKSTCSLGPMDRWDVRLAARICARFVFDAVVAREDESARWMRKVAGERSVLAVGPDIANLMPVPSARPEPNLIGIVPSFQMERQWSCVEIGYLDCMAGLIEHACARGFRVWLLPNQDKVRHSRLPRRSDTRVAQDILARLPKGADVEIRPICGRSGLDRKTDFARCTLLVSPRYHTCVSAMTCGVPTITLGWHCKYGELLRLYGQEAWLFSSERCSLSVLTDAVDRMFADHVCISRKILSRGNDVREATVRIGRRMLSDGRFMI